MAQNTTTNATDDVKPTVLHDFLGRSCAPAATFAAATDVAGGLGSERLVGTLYEGVPFFGQKTDASGPVVRYSGSKRGHGDSNVMPPGTSHLMKMLRNVGAERSRRPHEDEPFMGVHQMRPTSSSHIAQQYLPPGGQGVPYGYQPVPNIFKDSNAGSHLISHSAAEKDLELGSKVQVFRARLMLVAQSLNQAVAN